MATLWRSVIRRGLSAFFLPLLGLIAAVLATPASAIPTGSLAPAPYTAARAAPATVAPSVAPSLPTRTARQSSTVGSGHRSAHHSTGTTQAVSAAALRHRSGATHPIPSPFALLPEVRGPPSSGSLLLPPNPGGSSPTSASPAAVGARAPPVSA